MEQLLFALEGSNRFTPDYTLQSTVLSLLLAFVLGQAVAWLYSFTHGGLSYSRAFTQSLVLMAMVVTLVMFIIGNSIVTAFGLIGALAIIRFRNVLKDTRDTVFVFFTLVLGMAIGSQRYSTALIAVLAFIAVVLYLHVTSFGTQGHFDGHLTLRVPISDQPLVQRALHRYCRSARRLSTRQSGSGEMAELMYQVRLRDRRRSHELLGALQGLGVVDDLSLVLRDELGEM